MRQMREQNDQPERGERIAVMPVRRAQALADGPADAGTVH